MEKLKAPERGLFFWWLAAEAFLTNPQGATGPALSLGGSRLRPGGLTSLGIDFEGWLSRKVIVERVAGMKAVVEGGPEGGSVDRARGASLAAERQDRLLSTMFRCIAVQEGFCREDELGIIETGGPEGQGAEFPGMDH